MTNSEMLALAERLCAWLADVNHLNSRLKARSRTELFYPGSIAPELMRRSEEMFDEVVSNTRETIDFLRSLAAMDGAVVGWGVFGNGGLIDTLNSEEDAKAFAKFHFGEPHPDVEVSALYRAPPSSRYAEGYAAGIEAAAEWLKSNGPATQDMESTAEIERMHYYARRIRALTPGGNDV